MDRAVEPATERTRDLGVPDGLWWALTTLAGLAVGAAIMADAEEVVSRWVAELLGLSFTMGAAAFAARRWGHRRYPLKRAFVDGFAPFAVLWLIVLVVLCVRILVGRLP